MSNPWTFPVHRHLSLSVMAGLSLLETSENAVWRGGKHLVKQIGQTSFILRLKNSSMVDIVPQHLQKIGPPYSSSITYFLMHSLSLCTNLPILLRFAVKLYLTLSLSVLWSESKQNMLQRKCTACKWHRTLVPYISLLSSFSFLRALWVLTYSVLHLGISKWWFINLFPGSSEKLTVILRLFHLCFIFF